MDGDLDYIGDGVWRNDGFGYFTKSTVAGYGNGNDVVVQDFDGDGWLDIYEGATGKVWLGFGDGTSRTRSWLLQRRTPMASRSP